MQARWGIGGKNYRDKSKKYATRITWLHNDKSDEWEFWRDWSLNSCTYYCRRSSVDADADDDDANADAISTKKTS